MSGQHVLHAQFLFIRGRPWFFKRGEVLGNFQNKIPAQGLSTTITLIFDVKKQEQANIHQK